MPAPDRWVHGHLRLDSFGVDSLRGSIETWRIARWCGFLRGPAPPGVPMRKSLMEWMACGFVDELQARSAGASCENSVDSIVQVIAQQWKR